MTCFARSPEKAIFDRFDKGFGKIPSGNGSWYNVKSTNGPKLLLSLVLIRVWDDCTRQKWGSGEFHPFARLPKGSNSIGFIRVLVKCPPPGNGILGCILPRDEGFPKSL